MLNKVSIKEEGGPWYFLKSCSREHPVLRINGLFANQNRATGDLPLPNESIDRSIGRPRCG